MAVCLVNTPLTKLPMYCVYLLWGQEQSIYRGPNIFILCNITVSQGILSNFIIYIQQKHHCRGPKYIKLIIQNDQCILYLYVYLNTELPNFSVIIITIVLQDANLHHERNIDLVPCFLCILLRELRMVWGSYPVITHLNQSNFPHPPLV